MKYSISTLLLIVALTAIALGWCIDRYAYRNSIRSPDEFVDIGFALGKASESTLIYFMQDEENLPIDSNRFAHVRERELITNILSMAAVHETIATAREGDSEELIPEWRADKALEFAGRSLRLLNVKKVEEFQAIFEKHWDVEYVNAYKSDSGSLDNDLATFIELALQQNAEWARIYGE